MSELKPCPFCGSEHIDPKGWMGGDNKETGPACDDCGCTANSILEWDSRPIENSLESQLSALREKCAELKKERDSYMLLSKMRPRPFADTDAGLVAQVAELQRQLDAAIVYRDYHRDRCAARTLLELQSKLQDAERKLTTYEEAAKQEPVGCMYQSLAGTFHNTPPSTTCRLVDVYRRPPHLPALIEQAKREERDAALKPLRTAVMALASAATSNPMFACDPMYQGAYEEIDAAIRARTTGSEEGKSNPA